MGALLLHMTIPVIEVQSLPATSPGKERMQDSLEHDDLVAATDGGQSMGNEDRSAALGKLVQGGDDLGLRMYGRR